jgi:hypothetical protein
MATGENVYNVQWDALDSQVNHLNVPADNGVAVVDYNAFNILIVDAAITCTLETVNAIPTGVMVLVLAQAACTVESITLADGDAVLFCVTLNSSGNKVWTALFNTGVDSVTTFADDAEITFGTGSDAQIGWETGDASNHTLVMALGDPNQALHVTDKGAIATDWNVSADTHPTIYVHSNTTPATDYLLIGGHDGTVAGIDVVGGTTLDLRIAGTDIVRLTATALTLVAGTTAIVGASGNDGLFTQAEPQEDITDGVGGAISVATHFTSLEADAGGDAFTLADGTQIGQVKEILFTATAGGTAVVTVTNLEGGNTITFTAAGAFARLVWDGTNWVPVALYNQATGVITDPVVSTV